MPTQTRYFSSANVNVNGLAVNSLALAQSGVGETQSKTQVGLYLGCLVGVRIWKRTSAPAETEVTAGTPVAQVTTVDGDIHVEYDGTYTPAATALDATDSIVVRVYYKFGALAWGLLTQCEFTTEQLGASQLDNVLWTVHYLLSFAFSVPLTRAVVNFHFDGADNSRVTNFQWTAAVSGVLKRRLLNGLGL